MWWLSVSLVCILSVIGKANRNALNLNFDLQIEPDDFDSSFLSFDSIPGSSTSIQTHEPFLDYPEPASTG
jgi:hypothetical protein